MVGGSARLRDLFAESISVKSGLNPDHGRNGRKAENDPVADG
jgi:hypothetical protein